MPHSKTLCCWTWKTWTKIIAYFEATAGMIGIIFFTLFIIALITWKEEVVMPYDDSVNITFNLNSTGHEYVDVLATKLTATEFKILVVKLSILLIYEVAFTTLAVYLIIGVTKKNVKHVLLWIVIKCSLFLMSSFSQLVHFILTFFGDEQNLSEIVNRAIYLGIDALLIFIVFNYYRSERDAMETYDPNMLFPQFKTLYCC